MMTEPVHETHGSLSYYDGPEIADAIFEALEQAGLDTEKLEIDDLAALDEFHAVGRAATLALAELCVLTPGTEVLDVGAGIGGPARLLAKRFGAHVTALDQTARFCRANTRLSAACGLSERVSVVQGEASALPFADGAFEIAWTQALMQNIADKRALFSELHRVLRPDGRLVIFELLSGPGGGPLHFPVPWADDPAESYLTSGGELRESAEAAGFEVFLWNEGADARARIQRAAEAQPPAPPAHGIDLQLLMPNYAERMASMVHNVAEERVALVQAVLRPR
jgi:SAM-dependent methyltransferase